MDFIILRNGTWTGNISTSKGFLENELKDLLEHEDNKEWVKNAVFEITEIKNIELKEFKQKIKSLGYRTKTFMYNSSNLRFLQVLNTDKEFIVGAGVNCHSKTHIEQHKEVFGLLNLYRDRVFNNGQKVEF
jgi:hypothetical protein